MGNHLPARRVFVVLMDVASVLASVVLAFLLRFEFAIPSNYLKVMFNSLPLVFLIYLPSFWIFRLYAGIYRYSSFNDLLRIVQSVAVSGIASATVLLFVHHSDEFPRSVLLLSPLLTFLSVCSTRFAIRLVKSQLGEYAATSGSRPTLIIGAGDMGESLLRQLRKTPGHDYRVVGFIDDDPGKWNMDIHGVPILGGLSELPRLLKKLEIEVVLIAIGAKRGDIVRSVTDALHEAKWKAEIKVAPNVEEMFGGPGLGISLRDVKPSDLLNRKMHNLDESGLARRISGKTVLVTGAGGTIGGELTRQVLRYGPARLVLLENHATSLFYRELELRGLARGCDVVGVLGDVRDKALLSRTFDRFHPHAVLHAAAHKHVPQLESNVREGVQNNLLATYYLAEAAHRHGAECFLLISTDKAVRPASLMGATKRAAEMVVQAFADVSKSRFMAVRFGNVLGSSGSVLKIFSEQIAKGGPVTLTHPDMQRYFMTVEEAVQLVLHASTMASGGEVFVLKMGEPVRILDMARNLILLNGLEPDKDIRIEFMGLRPGEKLTEEILEDPAGARESAHPQIILLRGDHLALDRVDAHIRELEKLSDGGSDGQFIEELKRMVPTFTGGRELESEPEPSAPVSKF